MATKRVKLLEKIGLDVSAASGVIGPFSMPESLKALHGFAVARVITGGAGPACTLTLKELPFDGLVDKFTTSLVINNVNTVGTLVNKDNVPELTGVPVGSSNRCTLEWVTSGGPTTMVVDVIIYALLDV